MFLLMAFHWQRTGGLVITTADRTSQTVVQPSRAENFMAKMFSERELLRSQVVGQEARDQVSSWAGSLSCIHARSHSYISGWPVVWGNWTDAINKQSSKFNMTNMKMSMAQKFQSKTACAQSVLWRLMHKRKTQLVANLYQFIQFQIIFSYFRETCFANDNWANILFSVIMTSVISDFPASKNKLWLVARLARRLDDVFLSKQMVPSQNNL